MNEQTIKVLKSGGVTVLPTDTIYGLHALALDPKAVEKIYRIKSRGEHKPLIVLISSLEDLEEFDVKLTPKLKQLLGNFWPNPISIILPTSKFEYLHRGENSLAFRMPNNRRLLQILKETGPLVSTSANLEGSPPAETIQQAKNYFGTQVSFYLDGGQLKSNPSTLIRVENDKIEIIRQGSFEIPKNV